jgi:hypothetical protein
MLISKQQRDKNKTCFVEGWDVITKQKCNIPQQYDWQFIAILESSFLAISVFCLAIPITRHSEDVLVTKWSMTSSFTNSAWFLKLVSVQLKWSRNPPWYSHLVWIIPRWLHANLSKWVQQVWNLTDAGRQTWVADECQSWQRHLSSWCYGKTWLGKMTEVSQLRVIFWFNSHHC